MPLTLTLLHSECPKLDSFVYNLVFLSATELKERIYFFGAHFFLQEQTLFWTGSAATGRK